MNSKTCNYILLVEDDDDIRKQIANILVDEGYRVTTVENGQMALDHLLPRKPDDYPGCIILDLMMPVMTGGQFLTKVQSEYADNLAKIPVIVTTAKGSPKDELARLAPDVARIMKPMEIDDLVDIVNRTAGAPAP